MPAQHQVVTDTHIDTGSQWTPHAYDISNIQGFTQSMAIKGEGCAQVACRSVKCSVRLPRFSCSKMLDAHGKTMYTVQAGISSWRYGWQVWHERRRPAGPRMWQGWEGIPRYVSQHRQRETFIILTSRRFSDVLPMSEAALMDVLRCGRMYIVGAALVPFKLNLGPANWCEAGLRGSSSASFVLQ